LSDVRYTRMNSIQFRWKYGNRVLYTVRNYNVLNGVRVFSFESYFRIVCNAYLVVRVFGYAYTVVNNLKYL